MNVLLIACSFPPDPVVGSFRAAKVAAAFRGAGHNVHVITRRLLEEDTESRSIVPELRVHPVRSIPGPIAGYRAVKRLQRNGSASPELPESNGSPPAGSSSSARSDQVPAWKRHLLAALRVPDNHQGFIVPAILRSLPIIRGGVDLVYTTAPPFSDHLVGLALKALTGVRWVAEFRDPWTDNRNQPAHLRSAPAEAADAWLERQCLKHADHVVAVSEGIRTLIAAKMPSANGDRFLLALNGIDNLAPPSSPRGGEYPFRIVHTGSFYGIRDPQPFLRALAAVKTRRDLTAEDVRVDFIGHCRVYNGVSLEQVTRDLGIAELVHFHDWMPQEECREIARTADLFLLPFPDRPHLIPNKLYDYLGARKPILAFLDGSTETAAMLDRLGGHYVVSDKNPRSAEAALEAALQAGKKVAATGNEALLERWTTHRQMEHLLRALGVSPE